MKITAVRAKVYEWTGQVCPPQGNFCTNAMDILTNPSANTDDKMGSFRFHAWTVVEVETDTGIIGLGNVALAPHIAKNIIDIYLAPAILGEDPFDYEYLWQKMYRSTLAWGRKGIAVAAISAIDIALWDIMGLHTKKPVFKLLGGRTKSAIPVYASKLYAQPIPQFIKEAQGYVDAGYKMFKMRFGWGEQDGPEGMVKNEELVKALRETVGADADIMVECYMGWTLSYAKRMVTRLEKYNIRWLEEPVICDDVAGYAELRAMNVIPISGGEHEYTLYGFRDLLDRGAVDYIQYDTNRVGGITQAKKILALAEAYSVPVVPHAGQMHNYHLVMSSVICPMAEFFPKHPVEIGNELFWYIFDGEPIANRGMLQLDDTLPGMGLTLSDAHLDDFNIIV